MAQAPWLARLHLVTLAAAAVLGAVQLFAPKGRLSHRVAGWSFAGLLSTALLTAVLLRGVAGSSLDGWSPVHGMLALALAFLPLGIVAARRKDVLAHRAFMGAVFCALLTALLFSTVPGGALHPVVAGSSPGALAGPTTAERLRAPDHSRASTRIAPSGS